MIRKSLIPVLLFTMLVATDLFAVDREIYGKIGTGYASDPARYGLDLAAQYNYALDPYFVVGPEAGFFWVQWNRTIGVKDVTPGVRADVTADTNAYDIPVLMNATVRIPNLSNTVKMTPFVTVGLGYSFMLIHYSQPQFTDSATGASYESESVTKFFHGFTWQIVGGVGYQPERSKVEFRLEAGYRGSTLEHESLEIDMSCFMIHVGANYPLGG